MKTTLTAITLAAMTVLAPLASHAAVYNGNGANGFGGGGPGPVGNGALTVTSTPSGSVTFSFLSGATGGTPAAPTLSGNALALYLDTAPGGLASTATLADNQDGGREAISGANNGNTPPSRSLVTFAPGFTANYAINFEDSFVGVFGLTPTSGATPTNLSFQFGQGQTTEPDTITLTAAQAASIGITPGSTFSFVGSLISTSAYRSNETIGASTTVVDPTNLGAAPNAGFNGAVTFTGSDSFTLAPAPEPSGLASLLVGMAVLSGVIATRRRVSVK